MHYVCQHDECLSIDLLNGFVIVREEGAVLVFPFCNSLIFSHLINISANDIT